MCYHSHEMSRSRIRKINSLLKYGVTGLLFLGLFLISNQTLQATPSNDVVVKMYRLALNGGNTNVLCSSNDINYGCTAYPNDPTRSYPFSTDTITIDIEDNSLNGFQQGYLHNVTPHEVALTVSSQGNKPLSTVQAQAIAVRTYTYYHIDAGSTINNSNQFQVYIPYTYEKLTSAQQQRVDAALAEVSYMTAAGSTDPIRAHFGSDNDAQTQDGGESYLKSVVDPISDAYGQDDGTANGGMSSKGASRWGFGHTSSRGSVAPSNPQYPHDNQGNGDPWSVRWDDAKQILTHYYTDIHLRNGSGNIVTPQYRWNPLVVNWGNGATEPPDMQAGQTYNVTIQVQNTGAVNWGSDVRLSCQWQKPDGSRVNCQTQANPGTLTMGDPAPNVTLPVRLNNGLPNGHYTLIIDMKQGANFFHQREAGKPWPTLNYDVCAGGNCSESYFPVIMKRWRGLKCDDDATTIWYPTGNNSCNPSSISGCAQADGEPDGVYAGPFNLDQSHQVEFTPQLIRPETTIGTYWKKYSGDYAHLYSYIKVDDVWVGLPVDQFQGSGTAVWRWTNRGIGQYAGQYISGIQFKAKKSNPIANMRLIIDGYRIRDFTSCTW